MSAWIELDEAWSCIEREVVALDAEDVELADACGRTLVTAVHTDRDYPPFDRAAMDGYAVRSVDLRGATRQTPVELDVVGEARPGAAFDATGASRGAVRIMTGAPVPTGWDCVVPVESTSGFDTERVRVFTELAAGSHVASRGIERRAGEVLFAAGHTLRRIDIGALAMVGAARIRVARRAHIAILSTGNELVDFASQPGATQIRNSNAPMLAALAGPYGDVELLGAVEDSREATRAAVERGLGHDVLLLSGGVSMGAYDWVETALRDAGVRVHFRRVALQPGKPVLFGTHARGIVLALPGNPVSAYTTFRLFAQPALARLHGCTATRPLWYRAAARFEWQPRAPKCVVLPGRLRDAGHAVERVPYTGSGDLMAYARADCQIVLPHGSALVAHGDPVRIWPLDASFSHLVGHLNGR